jgi:putative ABC transport system substrate-binding protein
MVNALKRRHLLHIGMSTAALAAASACGFRPFETQPSSPRVARVGFIGTGRQSTAYLVDATRDGLRESGWVEGENLHIEYRWYGDQPDHIPDLAAELVALKPDVLIATATPAVLAFTRLSTSIPIVMAVTSDPVASGLIASYARPGGNVTGTTRTAAISLGVKLLDLLRQLAPDIARVAMVYEPADQAGVNDFREVQAAAQPLGIEVQAVGIASLENLQAALDAALAGRPQALISTDGVIIPTNYAVIAGFAVANRILTASDRRDSLDAGGLLYYGPQQAPLFRRAGSYYVDRILRGAKPADMPVEQPTVFDLVVNRTTAQSLRLTIPPEVAAQVTEWVQ